MKRWLVFFIALVAAVMTTVAPVAAAPEAPSAAPGTGGHGGSQPGCDPIDPAACLLPFPNDYFTVADRSTATGRRVAFSPGEMPRNVAGTPIDPAEWNRNDGFSPGTPILTDVPGVDLTKSKAASAADIGASLDRDAPIVLLDTKTGKRTPYWASTKPALVTIDRERIAYWVGKGAQLSDTVRTLLARHLTPVAAAPDATGSAATAS